MMCPPPGNFECLNDQSGAFSDIHEFLAAGGTVSDNCDIDSTSFAMFDEIIDSTQTTIDITRWYSIMDLCGNIATCSQTVSYADTIPPSVFCRDITVSLDQTGSYTLVTGELHLDSDDNCGIDTMYLDRYILDCDDLGVNYIIVTVVDVNGNSSTCVARVTVLGNTPPVAVNDTAATPANIAVDIDVPYNDYDSLGTIDRGSVSVNDPPANGSVLIDPQTGIITYTPQENYTGIDTFIYSICDDGIPCGAMCDNAMVLINVGDYNNPPVAVNDTFTVMCYPLTGYLLYNDYDPDGHDIFIQTTPVKETPNGTVTIYSDGSIHYMPDEGFVGVDSFVYRICDSGIPSLCDEATVIINVLPDTDCDNVPDYDEDDIDTDCTLLIPEGFSPNGDGVHDFFKIFCIKKYPNAIMRIFDRAGNKLFEKHHYGNLDVWGSDKEAWWWGTSDNKWILGRGTLPAGNYLYILELGTGEVRTGTVMIAY